MFQTKPQYVEWAKCKVQGTPDGGLITFQTNTNLTYRIYHTVHIITLQTPLHSPEDISFHEHIRETFGSLGYAVVDREPLVTAA